MDAYELKTVILFFFMIVIVLPCECEKAPYVKYYTDILIKKNISYDIISWNRDFHKENVLAYCSKRKLYSKLSKIVEYINYSVYVKKIINTNKYDFVIVFTLIPMVLLSSFLISKFGSNIIVDIRDYSSILKFPVAYYRFKKLISAASMVCISSPKFRNWLPKKEYFLSHNVSNDVIQEIPQPFVYNKKLPVKIVTIGLISYFEQNMELFRNIGNNQNFELHYYGYGAVEERLKKECYLAKYTNVFFHGKYLKSDEFNLCRGASFISCYCPDNKTKRTVLSNRLYLSLLLGIPLVTTTNSLQADIVAKYNIGIDVKSGDDIADKLIKFHRSFNQLFFLEGRDSLLNRIRMDYDLFESKLNNVLDINVLQ